MKFTFGIITSPDQYGQLPNQLNRIFESITDQESYDDSEIIIVGGRENKSEGAYKFISFDETTKSKWITRKKNIITENAKYDNIVYMHDYVSLMPGWYKGFEIYGDKFDICMTPILNYDGTRFRDWTLWPHDVEHIMGMGNRKCLLPYETDCFTKYMYISGAYWVAKKSVMEKFPLNEKLSWGEGEDVEWSKQVREQYQFSINVHSPVRLLKYKDKVFNDATPELISQLQKQNETI